MTGDDQRPRIAAVEAMAAAAELWRSHARVTSSYFTKRGLHHVAVDPAAYGIGYAPLHWTNLIDHLHRQGITDDVLLAAGLAQTSRRGTLIDRFRGRVMFPIADHTTGHVVGAIGRDLTDLPDVAKYLNSPTSALFRKTELLYGLAEQRHRLRNGGTPVLVEGPMDVLALKAADPRMVPIAACGTALTPTHIDHLASTSRSQTVILAFDNDDPGRTATTRAYKLLADRFHTVNYLPLPEAADPSHTWQSADATTHLLSLDRCKPAADLITDLALRDNDVTNTLARLNALHRATKAVAAMPAHEWQRQVHRISSLNRPGFRGDSITWLRPRRGRVFQGSARS